MVGVPVGVVFVLSTRDFRDPDRGVTLLLRNVETDVDISSLDPATGVLVSERAPRWAAAVGGADPATLGVTGARFEAFAAALRVGIRGFDAFCLLS